MFHLDYEYQQQTGRGPTGWSETFWTSAGSLTGARAAADALAPLLRACHSAQALQQTYHIREVTDTPGVRIPRNSVSVVVNEGPAPIAGRPSGMYPTTALRLRLYGASGRSNANFLKGMPDGADVEGYLSGLAGWTAAVNALTIYLATSGQFCRRAVDVAQQKKPVVSISTVGVVTLPAHGYPDQAWVRIGLTLSSPNIDQLYRISVGADPNTFTLIGFPTLSAPPLIQKSSYAQRQLVVSDALTEVIAEAITKRNVGRPRGSPVGRRTTPRF